MNFTSFIEVLLPFLFGAFLINLCVAKVDWYTTQTPPDTNFFNKLSSLLKPGVPETGLDSPTYGRLLLIYYYIFIKWLCLVVEYVSLPLALPCLLFHRR